ncbi:MAG: serine/threonine-protein kinase [Synergistaceae bacterium]|nr:serine/threonine-protein kinase [Synergistaceae bacterium]
MLALPLGTNISGYVVTGILGRGGFGVTYKGQDTSTGRDVAIKEYFPQDIAIRQYGFVQATSPAEVADFQKGKIDFLQEAKTLAMCNHPSIVRVLGFFEQFGTAYIVMEFISGETLHNLVENSYKNGMTEKQIKNWLGQIIDALDVVHKKGLTHRDVKPENILIRPNGNAVLIDFGAAKQITARNSVFTSVTLTHGYAPPEQYDTTAKHIGSWTDIYALGATIFFAMTGGTIPPRAIDRMNATSQTPQQEDPLKPMMNKLCAGNKFSQNFLIAVQKMLAISLNERLKSISEVKGIISGFEPTKRRKIEQEKTSQKLPQEVPIKQNDNNELLLLKIIIGILSFVVVACMLSILSR